MERFIFFVLIFAVVVGLAAPNGNSSQAQLNQQILVDANAPVSAASGSVDETAMSPSYGGDTELQRGPGGHFYTAASINGQSLPFVVDTGATSVALTVDVRARRASISTRRASPSSAPAHRARLAARA